MNYGESEHNLKTLLVSLADENNYNNAQNIVRVKMEDSNGIRRRTKYYDIPLIFTGEYPNKELHYVLVFIAESTLDKVGTAILPGDSTLEYAPGYESSDKLSNKIVSGYGILVNKGIKHNTTNHAVGHATGFNSDSNLPSNRDDIRYSFSPPLNKNYTTTEDQYNGNKSLSNIGLFITDNSVILKSTGGEIVLGPDGISLLGPKTETHQIDTAGVMMKNPIAAVFPEMILSFPVAIKNIPNLEFVLTIGNTVNRMAQTSIAVGKVTNIISAVV